MTADALAPRVARASAAMVLTMEDKQILVFHEEGFQLPVPSPFCEKLEIFSKINSASKLFSIYSLWRYFVQTTTFLNLLEPFLPCPTIPKRHIPC